MQADKIRLDSDLLQTCFLHMQFFQLAFVISHIIGQYAAIKPLQVLRYTLGNMSKAD